MSYSRPTHPFAGVSNLPDTRRRPATSSPAAHDPARVSSVSADQLLDEVQAARLLRLSPRTLQGWRLKGGGPPFVRLSRRCIRYRRGDLQEFLLQCLRRSTSDLGADGR